MGNIRLLEILAVLLIGGGYYLDYRHSRKRRMQEGKAGESKRQPFSKALIAIIFLLLIGLIFYWSLKLYEEGF